MKTFRYVLGKHTIRVIQINDRSTVGVHIAFAKSSWWLQFLYFLCDTLNSNTRAGMELVSCSRTLQQSG